MKELLFPKILFWIYCICVLSLALLPLNSVGELNNITVLKFRGDYFFHSLMMIPWMIFLIGIKSRWWIWLLFGLLFAFLIEIIQYFLPYRAYNVNDLVANIAGVEIGGVLLLITKKLNCLAAQRHNNA